MSLKTWLTDEEKYGLSEEEIKLATRWLRKHKTAGVIPALEAAKLFELFLLGDSIGKLAQHFPQYPFGQIAFTAAYKKWPADRDKMLVTLKDRVQAKVIKSILDQVDFLTSMMAVANTEHLAAMAEYIRDPLNTPKPSLRISSIKEYKDISETLYRIVGSATADTPEKRKASPMVAALENHAERHQLVHTNKVTQEQVDDISIEDIIE